MVAKKEKAEALLEPPDEIMSDDADAKQPNKKFLDLAGNDERDSQHESPSKTPRGRPRLPKKALKTYFPIREDREAMSFLNATPENQLLDKVIHREVYLID